MDGSRQSESEALLNKSKHFCMLPWSHMHVWPEGKVFPCCAADPLLPLSDYEGSLAEAWNSEKIRQLRMSMLQDRPSKVCTRCYDLEKVGMSSLRTFANQRFGKFIAGDLSATESDGTVRQMRMRHLDIRFSNLCNLKCRSCGPNLSHSWVTDYEAVYGKLPWKVLRLDASFWQDLKPHLQEVETAFFAGGEPIICDELYQILDHWLKIDHTNVELNYTTNFTTLKYRDKSVLDYWGKFPQTRISASLDAAGERAEFLRSGSKWKIIEDNRLRMLEELPDVYFEIAPTISVYNVWHFPDFHREWIEKGLVAADHLRLTILTNPSQLSIGVIPHKDRQNLIKKWELSLSQMRGGFGAGDNFEQSYATVIKFLQEAPEIPTKSFWAFNDMLDYLRKETVLDVFPELEVLREAL